MKTSLNYICERSRPGISRVPPMLLLLILGIMAGSCGNDRGEGRVKIRVAEDRRKVEISVDGAFFTAYIYPGEMEKPVLYPVVAPGGMPVTRGFPIEPGEGERVDHPHQVGLWFSFGDVNGYDFWNNSYAVPTDRKGHYGRIVHREITGTEVTAEKGILRVRMDWMAPDTEEATRLLEEQTTFTFRGTGTLRIIDRHTLLKAVAGPVTFTDNKEGMLAIRAGRIFEHPSEEPLILIDSTGSPSAVPVLDNEGVTGWYRNSSGVEGTDVWGKNARWVKLGATRGDQPYSIVIFDHPANINYPSCWHARDYGLFSVNNLGRQVYNPELEKFQFTLEKDGILEFRHRIVVASSDLSDQEIGRLEAGFIAD
jgi:hypothetical protein